jgi:hypothetical protein
MHLAFLTPLAALAVLLATIPLAAWFVLVRRDARARLTLALPPPVRASRLGPAIAILAAAALIGAAAAQPVIQHRTTHHERTDAEAWVVFDISLSMAASPGPRTPDRLERARRFALALRPRLASTPVGVASITDRVLPHLFPTPDEGAFAGDVRRAIAVNRPPPQRFYSERATALGALEQFVTAAYFGPEARYRVLIVLTDGESQPVSPALADVLGKPPGVHVVFVHVWRSDDRIYPTSVADPNYHPDPNSGALLEQAAAAVHGTAVSENNVGAAVAATREALGSGPIRKVSETARVALMPWVTLAAFLPLGFVLWRRNL